MDHGGGPGTQGVSPDLAECREKLLHCGAARSMRELPFRGMTPQHPEIIIYDILLTQCPRVLHMGLSFRADSYVGASRSRFLGRTPVGHVCHGSPASAPRKCLVQAPSTCEGGNLVAFNLIPSKQPCAVERHAFAKGERTGLMGCRCRL